MVSPSSTAAQALAGAIRILEEEYAPAGALRYAFDETGSPRFLGGSLRTKLDPFPSWFSDDPTQDEPGRAAGTLVFATELIPRRVFESSEAYREFYGPHAIDHIACLRVRGRVHGAPSSSGLMLARAPSHGALPRRAADTLASQAPLVAALEVAAAREQHHQAVVNGLTQNREPLLIFDADGRCVGQSQAAHSVLASRSHRTRADLDHQIRDVISEMSPQERRRAQVWFPEVDLAIRLERHGGCDTDSVWFVYLAAEEIEQELSRRFQLTPTESAVLTCLGDGMSNARIAEFLDMATGTAATHVKAVLGKLAVSSRLQAGLLSQRAQLLGRVD
ncbi:MAG: helix-turn-helix transcriptional regulator [Myxococcota bacterium]